MFFSDKWIREVHKRENGVEVSSVLTFCGALEVVYKELSFYWNSNTKKKNESSYENIILPALKDHNDKTISEYCKDDFEEAINIIRRNGYINNGVHYFYSDATIKNFEKLIYYVIYFASCRGLCENVLWGSRFELDVPTAQEKVIEKVKLKKSLTPKQEKKLIKLLLADVDAPGEWVAVLLMLGMGLRNAETCGLNYGDIKQLEEYPNDTVAWIYKTTIPETSTLQSSGKTWNAGRIIPVPQKIVEYLCERKQLVETHIEAMGVGGTVNIEQLPIVCKGYPITHDNYKKRASARDVTNAARTVFQAIDMEAKQLAFLEAELVEEKLSDVVNEKDATAYLLRRNYATHLQILGLSIAEIQYLIGHDVEDAYESRNEFVDEARIHKMAKSLNQRPLLNDISKGSSIKEFIIRSKEEIRITIKGKEPLDELLVDMKGGNANMNICGSITTESYEHEYCRTIDIINQYHKAYL